MLSAARRHVLYSIGMVIRLRFYDVMDAFAKASASASEAQPGLEVQAGMFGTMCESGIWVETDEEISPADRIFCWRIQTTYISISGFYTSNSVLIKYFWSGSSVGTISTLTQLTHFLLKPSEIKLFKEQVKNFSRIKLIVNLTKVD